MEKDKELSSYQMTLAFSEGFECVMEHAEVAFSKEYSCYSDFEEDFQINLPDWHQSFVDFSWKSFCEEFERRTGNLVLRDVSHKGAFFEQVDYVFIFVFSIIGDRRKLREIVRILTKYRELDGDNFSLVIDDIEKHFSPSYSGAEKGHIWSLIAADGIEWPPKICGSPVPGYFIKI